MKRPRRLLLRSPALSTAILVLITTFSSCDSKDEAHLPHEEGSGAAQAISSEEAQALAAEQERARIEEQARSILAQFEDRVQVCRELFLEAERARIEHLNVTFEMLVLTQNMDDMSTRQIRRQTRVLRQQANEASARFDVAIELFAACTRELRATVAAAWLEAGLDEEICTDLWNETADRIQAPEAEEQPDATQTTEVQNAEDGTGQTIPAGSEED